MTETTSPRHLPHGLASRGTPARPQRTREGAGQLLARLDAAPAAG